jgi:hypothetical protein
MIGTTNNLIFFIAFMFELVLVIFQLIKLKNHAEYLSCVVVRWFFDHNRTDNVGSHFRSNTPFLDDIAL